MGPAGPRDRTAAAQRQPRRHRVQRRSSVAPVREQRSRLRPAQMSDIMSNMGSTITVRELQKHLKRVLATVARGHTLQVTRRRRLVAVLGPPRRTTAAAWPDLEARARSVL